MYVLPLCIGAVRSSESETTFDALSARSAPRQLCIQYDTVADSPADPRSRPHLLSQLGRAHVICLVYSISEPSSFDRVAEYWLPLFRKEGINVS